MKLLVQEFLETHTFKELQEQHGVCASFNKGGYKFSINYDMLESKESDLLSQQCRGLILATHDGRSLSSLANEIDGRLKYDDICPGKTVIIAYPMDRFFNLGQGAAADINWSDPKLAYLQKLDGTLIILAFDKFVDKWFVSTRAVSEADVELDGGLFTFRTLFEKALRETNGMTFDEFTDKLNKEITYCFELTSPINRVVVSYNETRITLIAARQMQSLHELDISDVSTYGVPHVQSYTFACVNDLVEWVSNQNPLEHEGVVVVDSNFNRIKIKNAQYVAFNRARDILGSSERNCLELVLAGHDDDVISAMPQEIADRILKIKQRVVNFIKIYDSIYLELKSEADKTFLNDKKTFALLVKNNKDIWSAPMFTVFDGKAFDMKDFIFKNKKNGTWSDSFLDKILNIILAK